MGTKGISRKDLVCDGGENIGPLNLRSSRPPVRLTTPPLVSGPRNSVNVLFWRTLPVFVNLSTYPPLCLPDPPWVKTGTGTLGDGKGHRGLRGMNERVYQTQDEETGEGGVRPEYGH